MNRTEEFHEVLQKVKNKQDQSLDPKINNSRSSLNRKLLPTRGKQLRTQQSTDFAHGVKELVKTITRMKNFLLENRKDYINL